MVCRLCLSESASSLAIFSDERIRKSIAKFLQLELTPDDPVSKVICSLCWKQLESFQIFSLRVDEAQKKLATVYDESNNEVIQNVSGLGSRLKLLKKENIADVSDVSIENMSVKQLQGELKKRKLPVNGCKRTLQKRIREYDKKYAATVAQQKQINEVTHFANSLQANAQHKPIPERNSQIFADGNLRAKEWELIEREKKLIEKERQILIEEQKLDIEIRNLEEEIKTRTTSKPKLVCTIQEIADILPYFSPGDVTSLSTELWVKRVESLLKLCEWDEKLLLMAVISKMQGNARIWWDTNQAIYSSWDQFADGLKLNFSYQFSDVEIHQHLRKRIKKPNESVESYCLEMQMLGKRIQLADKTIIKYILIGLNDPQTSVSLAVCNFKDIPELIQKIRSFESIKTNALGNCYNCNQPGHFSRHCTQARKRSWNRENIDISDGMNW